MSTFLLDDDNDATKAIHQYFGFSPKTAELKMGHVLKKKGSVLVRIHLAIYKARHHIIMNP